MATVSIPVVIGGMLVFAGGLLILGGLYEYYTRKRNIGNSERISATVLSSKVAEHRGIHWRKTHKPSIEFEYSYRDQRHTSDVLYPSMLDENVGYDWAESVVEDYQEGETVTAYVSPKNPGEAFLKRGSERGKAMLAVLELTGFLLVGIGAMIL